MEAILLVVQLVLALGIIGVVLLQKSDSDGFGLGGGGGGGGNVFSARGQANFLTRTTALLATLFILNSLVLSIVAANRSDRGSLAERLEQADRQKAAPAIEEVIEELPGSQEAPAVPKAE